MSRKTKNKLNLNWKQIWREFGARCKEDITSYAVVCDDCGKKYPNWKEQMEILEEIVEGHLDVLRGIL